MIARASLKAHDSFCVNAALLRKDMAVVFNCQYHKVAEKNTMHWLVYHFIPIAHKTIQKVHNNTGRELLTTS